MFDSKSRPDNSLDNFGFVVINQDFIEKISMMWKMVLESVCEQVAGGGQQEVFAISAPPSLY